MNNLHSVSHTKTSALSNILTKTPAISQTPVGSAKPCIAVSHRGELRTRRVVSSGLRSAEGIFGVKSQALASSKPSWSARPKAILGQRLLQRRRTGCDGIRAAALRRECLVRADAAWDQQLVTGVEHTAGATEGNASAVSTGLVAAAAVDTVGGAGYVLSSVEGESGVGGAAVFLNPGGDINGGVRTGSLHIVAPDGTSTEYIDAVPSVEIPTDVFGTEPGDLPKTREVHEADRIVDFCKEDLPLPLALDEAIDEDRKATKAFLKPEGSSISETRVNLGKTMISSKPLKYEKEFSVDEDRDRALVVGEVEKKEVPGEKSQKSLASDFREICALALPALGSVIADPLMSLVDTACVGQLSAVQLAALGPNTAIFNYVFQMFAFVGVATTNIIATNSPSAKGLSPEERKRRKLDLSQRLSDSLTLAVFFGIVCTTFMETMPVTLLNAMGASVEMLPPALEYLRVRALASPAVMIMCAAQGACLGQQDAWTPLKIFVVAGLVNLVGDIGLISYGGFGVAGAAWATLFAQYLGAAMFLFMLHRRGKKEGVPLRWRGIPSLSSLRPYMQMAGTLVPGAMVRMSAYALLTWKATAIGTIACAAHQVTLQVFRFLLFVPEPLSLTAQSLIARDLKNPNQVQRVAKLLLAMGAAMGVSLGMAVMGIYTFLPWVFTSDVAVASEIVSLCPQAFLAVVALALTMVMDGISIGAGDYKHLPRSSFIATLGCWCTLNFYGGACLGHVWWGLVVFCSLRCIQHIFHVGMHYDHHPLGHMSVAKAA